LQSQHQEQGVGVEWLAPMVFIHPMREGIHAIRTGSLANLSRETTRFTGAKKHRSQWWRDASKESRDGQLSHLGQAPRLVPL